MIENCFDVINFHLTEKCNYKCKYCFAKFHNNFELGLVEWKKVVDIVYEYFIRNGVINGRINLAGGEPLMVSYLDELIAYINDYGIKVSIITNASLLTKQRIDKWINKVDILGISIDSLNSEVNYLIGRNAGSKTIDIKELIEIIKYAKKKGINIKVNTVVSKLNIKEDLLPLYKSVEFDRIKILQVRINQNCNYNAKELEITQEEFEAYFKKYNDIENIIIESEKEMEGSYVIVDPRGNLISNKNNCYLKIGSLLNEEIESLIVRAELDYNTYLKRYKNHQGGNYEFTT